LEQVLEIGSFRAAAVKAKISTPAVSQAISSLEKLVGKPLIIRKDGKILPTHAASQLIAASKPAIQALRELSIQTAQSESNIAWISFGAYESLAVHLLPELTTRLQKKLPKLKLTVRIGSNSELASMVRNGELCAAVVEENDNLGRLLAVPVGQDRLGCYISASSIEKERVWDTTRPIAAITPGANGYPRYYTKFIQAKFGKNFKPSVLSDTYEALRAAAVHGSAMAILPSRVANRRPGELIEIHPPGKGEISSGTYPILLISQPNCDPIEIQLLTSEISPILKSRHDDLS
jgi:DNA-binding transcriptional LysR family regulator